MLNESGAGVQDKPPKQGWGSYFASFLPSKRTVKKIGSNLLELTGTALQIASEITTFVGGMVFLFLLLSKKSTRISRVRTCIIRLTVPE